MYAPLRRFVSVSDTYAYNKRCAMVGAHVWSYNVMRDHRGYRRPANSKPILVSLTSEHQALLGMIRVHLGKNGNPVTMAAAIRAALEYMSEAFRTAAQVPPTDDTKAA